MKRTFLFEYNPDELFELVKTAVREVLAEQQAIHPIVNSPPPSIDVLSPAEVCSLLHISRPTLNKLNKQGKLKGKRLGGKIFYLKSAVEKVINNIK